MRLSSPTFDEQVGDLSQEDINAFDFLDAQLSQVPSQAYHKPRKSPRVLAQPQSVDDEENPFYETRGGQMGDTPNASGSGRIYASFTRASAVNEKKDASSASGALDDSDLPDEAPPEVDYTAWFNSDSANTFVGFQTATMAKQDALPGFQRPSINGAKPKAFLIPSAAALRKAEEKMKEWQEDGHPSSPQSTPKEPASSLVTQPLLSPRPAFSTATKVFSPIQVPETPTPAPNIRSANAEPPPTSIRSSFQSLGGKKQLKPFKPPSMAAAPLRPIATANFNSPLRVHQPIAPVSSQVSSTPAPLSPLRPSSVANQVMSQKPLGFTPRHGSTTRPKFVTPFKVGLNGPSTLGITKNTPTPLRQGVVANRIYPPSLSHSPRPSKLKDKWGGKIFDISTSRVQKTLFLLTLNPFTPAPPPGRQTLATSGLHPQAYSAEELEDMGMFVCFVLECRYALTTYIPVISKNSIK
jgi:breast cancer 2 susceptibility protein